MNTFLPVNKKDMLARGWEQADFVYITGDSYVVHPSFGAAIITRVLEAKGFKVAVLSQPDVHSTADFVQFGKPRLAYLITSGNIDSMVAHYTVAKKRRSTDAYTAGGVTGKRPDRAVTVYSNIVKELYPEVPVIIGGLEASLRRFAHYDYWDDRVRPSILIDSTGTKKIVALASYVLEAIEKGRILVVDELDSSLHFKLTRAIVALFNNEINTAGQLIFTIHDISLLDCKRLFRKEQVWFIHKDRNRTWLYSLAEFKSRNHGTRDTTDIIEHYKKGVYGAVPEPSLIKVLLEVGK